MACRIVDGNMHGLSIDFPARLEIGSDVLGAVGRMCRPFGNRALIVSESVMREAGHIAALTDVLRNVGVEPMVFDELLPGSTAEVASEIATLVRASKTQMIVALGGVRAMSLARIVANVAQGKASVDDLMNGNPPEEALPCVEVPATFRHHFMLRPECVARNPRSGAAQIVRVAAGTVQGVVVDAALTATMSRKYALAAIMDSLLAAVEAYSTAEAAALLPATVLERAISELQASARTGARNPGDTRYRVRAAEAGVLTAFGISASGQGMGGALAYALNARLRLPTSWVATILLPHVVDQLVTRAPEQCAAIARVLGEPVGGIIAADDAPRAPRAIRKVLSQLDLPTRLRDLDVTLDELIEATSDADAGGFPFLAKVPGGTGTIDLRHLVSSAY